MAALVVLACCGGGSGAMPDAGGTTDAGADGAIAFALPEPPEPPALPVLTPCPGGWREIAGDDGNPATCDPWPEGGQAACAADEAHFPGEPGCTRIGTACPVGEWPEGLPEGVTIYYVRPGDPGTGDGTIADPFGRISDISTTAADGSIIALAKGTHPGPVTLKAGVSIWGACVAETILAATDPAGSSALSVTGAVGPVSEVRNLQVTSASHGVMTVRMLELESVVIGPVAGIGLGAFQSGKVTATELAIRDISPNANPGAIALGVWASTQGDAELHRVVIERSIAQGVRASGVGSELTLTDVAILDTADEGGTPGGRGLEVGSGAIATAERIVIERGSSNGAFAAGSGTTLSLTDALVRNTLGRTDGTFGHGIAGQDGAQLTVDRTMIEGSRTEAILLLVGALSLSDVLIRDSRGRVSDGSRGRGMAIDQAVSLQGSRLLIQRSQELGILVFRSTIDLSDVTIEDTLGEESNGSNGNAWNIEWDSTATLHRVAIRNSRTAGLVLNGDTTLTATDILIEHVADQESDGRYGQGLALMYRSIADLQRVRISDTHEVGIGVFFDSELTATDVDVSDAAAAACAETTCPGMGWGVGVGTYDPTSQIELTRFRIRDSALGGVQVATGGTADLHDGEIANNPIGANIQTADYEVERLLDRVRFLNNGTDLDSITQPVPQPPGF